MASRLHAMLCLLYLFSAFHLLFDVFLSLFAWLSFLDMCPNPLSY